MAQSKKVQRRSDGKVFDSIADAGTDCGRHPGVRIGYVCRLTAQGIYAQAYGEQWRFWKPGPMPNWPEKGVVSTVAKKQRADRNRLYREARAMLTESIPDADCREFVKRLFEKYVTPEALEAQYERQADGESSSDS